MKFLYIGQYSEGTTSKMRVDLLRKLLPGADFRVIDTHVPFYEAPTWSRSFGFRFKRGPLISRINRYILEQTGEQMHDCIWTDKAVFITKKTTEVLKSRTRYLIHFTPDPAFTFHQSGHFSRSLPLYDYAVTTKSYEVSHYRKVLADNKILLITQGFDPSLHKPYHSFAEKKWAISFIGHNERERELILETLVKNGFPVILAGRGWKKIFNKYAGNHLLDYRGDGIYGEDYARLLSEFTFSLGALSKWVPEKHTTRTFEIPACGTALVSERNDEICSFFREEEAILYSSPEEMVSKLKYYLSHRDELEQLTARGTAKVNSGPFCYETQLSGILDKAGLRSSV